MDNDKERIVDGTFNARHIRANKVSDDFDEEFNAMFRRGKVFITIVWVLVICTLLLIVAAGALAVAYGWREFL